jgi:hypothetical protein
MTTQSSTGTRLTCTNDDCPCVLEIVTPCPHGDTYTCGCGHQLRAIDDDAGSGVGARAQAAGIVDQQAAVLDEMDESG